MGERGELIGEVCGTKSMGVAMGVGSDLKTQDGEPETVLSKAVVSQEVSEVCKVRA